MILCKRQEKVKISQFLLSKISFCGININSKIMIKRTKVITIKRLNIFIDESGDFGFVDGSSDL